MLREAQQCFFRYLTMFKTESSFSLKLVSYWSLWRSFSTARVMKCQNIYEWQTVLELEVVVYYIEIRISVLRNKKQCSINFVESLKNRPIRYTSKTNCPAMTYMNISQQGVEQDEELNCVPTDRDSHAKPEFRPNLDLISGFYPALCRHGTCHGQTIYESV